MDPELTDDSELTDPADERQRHDLAARIAELAAADGVRIAVAESLTGGLIACALAASPGAGQWFRGSVVAYDSDVKHDVLGVPPGPVVSATAASAMAVACGSCSTPISPSGSPGRAGPTHRTAADRGRCSSPSTAAARTASSGCNSRTAIRGR